MHTHIRTDTHISVQKKNSQISIIHKHNNNIFLTKSYKTLNKYINTHSLIWWAWLKQSLTKYSQLIDISPVLPMQVCVSDVCLRYMHMCIEDVCKCVCVCYIPLRALIFSSQRIPWDFVVFSKTHTHKHTHAHTYIHLQI